MGKYLVSVILPIHNNEQYLRDAIQSVLDQTYRNFELILLISATTSKESLEIINSFIDERIRCVYRLPEENLPRALNRGISESKGVYIARMDSDDISLPQRFSRQIEFMENHPNISILGTWVETFGTKKNFIKHPTESEEIKASLLFQTSIVHPTVMFRKSDLEKFNLRYNESFSYSEDAEMWSRSAQKVKISNLPEVLLKYRLHQQQATIVGKNEHSLLREEVKIKQLEYIGLKPTKREFTLHMMISAYEIEGTKVFLAEVYSWLQKIIEANKKIKYYDELTLKKLLAKKWFEICYINVSSIRLSALIIFFKYPLWKYYIMTSSNILRIFKLVYKVFI